jgi:hypothetical protein
VRFHDAIPPKRVVKKHDKFSDSFVRLRTYLKRRISSFVGKIEFDLIFFSNSFVWEKCELFWGEAFAVCRFRRGVRARSFFGRERRTLRAKTCSSAWNSEITCSVEFVVCSKRAWLQDFFFARDSGVLLQSQEKSLVARFLLCPRFLRSSSEPVCRNFNLCWGSRREKRIDNQLLFQRSASGTRVCVKSRGLTFESSVFFLSSDRLG